METKICVVCCLFVAAILFDAANSEDEESEAQKPCKSNKHVCTTLMKYPDVVQNEGPYCQCKPGQECLSSWRENDERGFIWQHYERAHWKIEYMFCSLHFPERICKGKEVSATLQTETKSWNPFMKEARCRCPSNVHQLLGWKKKEKVWEYTYNCEKEQCKKQEGVCAKIYIHNLETKDRVKEVKFVCACKAGFMCPARFRDEDLKNVTDNGQYVERMCESIKQSL